MIYVTLTLSCGQFPSSAPQWVDPPLTHLPPSTLQAETVEERQITQMPDIHQFKNQVELTVLTFTAND